MRVLVVKTSSLGDIIHTLPALTDAARVFPGIVFDWVAEENFAEIPAWHPAVERVVPIAIRRWRKNIFSTLRSGEYRERRRELNLRRYDCVIDAQGLFKSAWIARWASAPIIGLDKNSAREPLASLFYQRRIAVPWQMHAVERVRLLFAQTLGYELPASTGDYGLDKSRFASTPADERYIVFLHGTTRADKHWPEPYWRQLCAQVTSAGYDVVLPWGNDTEHERARRIAAVSPRARVLPRMNLRELAGVLVNGCAVVAVDTGLGHLTAALDVPALSLYGPTSPTLIGAYGRNQIHLSAKALPTPAGAMVEPRVMAPLTPQIVWQALSPLLTAET